MTRYCSDLLSQKISGILVIVLSFSLIFVISYSLLLFARLLLKSHSILDNPSFRSMLHAILYQFPKTKGKNVFPLWVVVMLASSQEASSKVYAQEIQY